MVPIMSLWLPILVSSVFVFIASSVIHMFLKYHAKDFASVPDENKLMDAIRGFNIPPGEYLVPRPTSMSDMKSPEYIAKVEKGPGILLTLWPGGRPSMTTNLIQWFVYSIVIGVFAAYVAGRALGPGAHYLSVFRFVGVTAFVCYSLGGWQESIWYKRAFGRSLRNTIDGLIYGCLTAGTFGWFWPD